MYAESHQVVILPTKSHNNQTAGHGQIWKFNSFTSRKTNRATTSTTIHFLTVGDTREWMEQMTEKKWLIMWNNKEFQRKDKLKSAKQNIKVFRLSG